MQQRRVQLTEDVALARQEAREIQRTYPTMFRKMPVPVSDVADALGLAVEKRSELRQRARLEILEEDESESATIAVRESLDRNVSRFAVAHEIGHAVLLRKHPEAARQWDVRRREAFASIFAAELLTSSEVRTRMAESFRKLVDPLALLRFATHLGLSPRALLTMASMERSWIEGLDRIWLRVKYLENAFTHSEPKLRIVSAYYDKSRFYIATNQGLTRFAGTDQWLASLPVGTVARHRTVITLKLRRPAPAVPKFISKQLSADLSAVRLQPSSAEPVAYLIILADLTGEVHVE